MFKIEMLPADEGDCLLVEYGTARKRRRLLIDCGTRGTIADLRVRLGSLRSSERDFDLFVLTHIDGDHIGGAIEFLKERACGLTFKDVWFNGWKHLPKRRLGARQAEIFSTLIRDGKLTWNKAFDGDAVMLRGNHLPSRKLPGGMRLTLLSPTREKLERLAVTWQRDLKKHALIPGSRTQYRQFLGGTRPTTENIEKLAEAKFGGDASRPNGSSIAFLAEYGGKSALIVGDAHAPVLQESIEKLIADRGGTRLKVNAFKIPHHGSQNNLNKEVVQLLDCRKWLVSTSGSKFKHPDGEAIARIVKYARGKPQLLFNYATKYNEFWGREDVQEQYGYTTKYPKEDRRGLVVSL
jgi:beta-lactamase superfamily II metal-dependent hydrolase